MHEPYEYDSGHESIDEMVLDEADKDNMEEKDDRDLESHRYSEWLSTVLMPEELKGEPVWVVAAAEKKHTILPVPQNGEVPENSSTEPVEHIPGPQCTEVNAYSGRRISLEEMRGCRTAQCLIHKSTIGTWAPDGLDQDWELSGDYFLSGLCDGMPSRDVGSPTVFPARGGVARPRAENIVFDPEGDPNDHAMPFHPWCFDIYSRLAKCHFDHLNLKGLINWRNTESSFEKFHQFPRVGDVLGAQEQFWLHEPGNEYLAANPLHIPKLPPLLLAAVKEDESFTPHNGAFDRSQSRERDAMSRSPMEYSTDPLLSLPQELRLMIINSLGSRDIANLRLASRAFQQLPICLWYRLIREEMPWLWEAWDESECDHIPSIWTAATANEIQTIAKIRKRYAKVLKQEYQSGELDPQAMADMIPWPPTVPQQIVLPRGRTNWYEVYSGIIRNWNELKGLQNRRRIWDDVEEIITRIKKYQE
ncbi:hypothetical protein BDV28DRAFT_127619 [Aspergillus coremiiformis]|uniref:F-box domain-containing protein n=1 Tax=Aspergillus coremiiformis TaxID=138285 RepID=A0A5N6ZEY4_9EURO|nr:hypothetical protein BDV28DRAFT_127619 [Aspergillus coremiiformis]